ncbi:MAG: oligosaccharide flippase family protein [bacterium]
MGLITATITPRALGPQTYGNFNFLTNFFHQIVAFLDMGTSIGFYAKLSQRQKDYALITFYFYFMAIVAGLVILFPIVAFKTSLFKFIWPDQTIHFVFLAALFGILTWLIQILTKITDAYGLTAPAEIVKALECGFLTLILGLLYIFGRLNLESLFYSQIFLSVILGFVFWWIIKPKCKEIGWKINTTKIKNYLKEFYTYSHPLFVYALVGLLVGLLDRWLLQIFAGSREQGFYGLSYTIGAFCSLFTGAMQPLLMREFSISYGDKNIEQMKILFRKYIPLFYSIAAYFACFVAIQSAKVVYIFAGSKYHAAILPVAIMAFFPIHQTYGQLSGSVFYATDQTALYRNIGITMMLIGLPITYILLAPTNMFGLEAGALGLAIKMVALQFITVNIQLYFNAKYLRFSYFRYLGHQILVLLCFTGLAGVSYLVIDYSINNLNVVIRFLLSGMVYTGLVALLTYYVPIVFGLNKPLLNSIISMCLALREQMKSEIKKTNSND